MTLPFRRRHHDNDSSHDHAREMVGRAFLEPLPDTDQQWLDGHLAACGECRLEREAYIADREALRALRDPMPQPPRDLWARTAAAIESEGRRRPRSPLALAPLAAARPTGISLGILSGTLVALVVVATSVLQPGPVPIAPSAASQFVVVPTSPGATPITVPADPLAFIRQSDDGSYQLVFATVDKVCPNEETGCAPLGDKSSARIKISAEPQSVVLSPSSKELIVATAADGSGGGDVLVVPVPQARPSGEPTDVPTQAPTAPSTVTPPPGSSAPATEAPTPTPTPAPTPDGARSIVSGVRLVGDPTYSADGRWLAFSAAPKDGSAGPDLYVWRPGQDLAVRVTDDGATYFAGWAGDRILASRILPAAEPTPAASASPDASAAPGETPRTTRAPAAATTAPHATRAPARATATPPPSVGASATPGASAGVSPEPSGPPAVEQLHPASILLDPETGSIVDLATPDMWRPVVDPTGHFVVYWSGTVVPDATRTEMRPGTGSLVLDAWAAPEPPDASAAPSGGASLGPSSFGSGAPSASFAGSIPPTDRPSGSPASHDPGELPAGIVEGTVGAFHAHFDPRGSRLAVWWSDDPASAVGTLRLFVLDPAEGRIDVTQDPLPGVTALSGFSIEDGRLAWATPPGQNGEGSHVQVLGWAGDEFGQVQSFPAQKVLVVR